MDNILISVLGRLDVRIKNSVTQALSQINKKVNEIRIRENSRVYLTVDNENIPCDLTVDRDMLQKSFEALCSGTLHTHMETIKNGYLVFGDGVRVGVSGHALTEEGKITNVYDITSINIRIPYPIYGICDKIYSRIKSNDYFLNTLIYSLPGGGKTTMIRDLAFTLANQGNKRVAIIDTRCEIADSKLRACGNIDIYSAYPKARAMEYAIRTMNPQYLICDEIGALDEAQSLLSVQSAGVPIIATAHAKNIVELMRRKNISLLHENGVFDIYVGIRRNAEGKTTFLFCNSQEI